LTEPRFYFDESVDLPVSKQLALAGLDVVSAHSLKALGDKDSVHLQRATEMGRVLCTSDTDFLILAQQHTEHAGVVFGQKQSVSIGDWVRYLRYFHATKTAEEVAGMVFYMERR
jgi:predicted nuclease of predicted toxin-antitoxin system